MNKIQNLTKLAGDMYWYIIFLIVLTGIIGSLFFSEMLYLNPCPLCIWQRLLMYPLIFVAAAGILFKKRFQQMVLIGLTTLVSVLGFLIAGYHYLYQMTDVFGAESTLCADGGACKFIDWQIAGFITIPLLAFIAFTVILFLSLVKIYIFSTKNE